MNDRLRAVDCPSCGAPLELPAQHQRLFRCNFCGTTLEDLSPPQAQEAKEPPKIIIHTSTVSPPPAPSVGESHKSKRLGWLVIFLLLGFVGAVVLIPLVLSGQLFTGNALVENINRVNFYSFGLSRLVPADDDSQPDLVGVTYGANETHRMVYVDFDADDYLRWQSEPLDEGTSYTHNHVVAAPSAIYMAYESTLIAFNRQDGAILWQLALTDKVSHICQDCLQVVNGWLVALSDDGILSGIDPQNGDLAWSVRLNKTPRQLLNINGNVGVLDEVQDRVGLQIYAPETGTFLQQIVPVCPNDVFPDSPHTMGVYDPVLASTDGAHLFIPVSGYETGCLQKWNTAAYAIEWEASLPDEIIRALDRETYLLLDETLYSTDGHNLYATSLLDGSYRDVFSDEDHYLYPLAEKNGILITLAERRRGSLRYSLWGINPHTQSTAWQFEPAAEEYHEGGSSVVHDNGLWGVGPDADQVIVLEFFTDPGTLIFTALNPADGSTTSENTFEVNDDDSTYWIQLPGWDQNHVYLEMDIQFWLFNALTGEQIAVWP